MLEEKKIKAPSKQERENIPHEVKVAQTVAVHCPTLKIGFQNS